MYFLLQASLSQYDDALQDAEKVGLSHGCAT